MFKHIHPISNILASVFMSPETAITKPWRKLFKEGKIAIVAIDEAHCISEWLVFGNKCTCITKWQSLLHWHYNRGEKFRTSFQQLGGLRAQTPAPFMALTASAPANVEAEVKAILELHNCIMVSLPLDRPNIYISTKKKSSLSVRLVPSWGGVLYNIIS